VHVELPPIRLGEGGEGCLVAGSHSGNESRCLVIRGSDAQNSKVANDRRRALLTGRVFAPPASA
jgi:hypothetical protein